jgi:ubiquinone/menaquinone biosynthesis C-methylase UbiE
MSSKVYFDQIAPQWDSLRQSFFSEGVRQKALALAGVQAGQTAADIGAGSGFITEALLGEGLRVIAVDQSEEMLAKMRRKFDNGVVEYRLGEAEQLPLADESVDYVFANMYLHHVETPPAAIKEMVRTLKPGGKLVIADLDEHNFEFLRTEQFDRWLGFKRGEIRDWFVAAGLQNVQVEGIDENCCADSCCGQEKAEVTIFAAVGQKGPVNVKEEVRQHYGTIAEQYLHPVTTIELLETRPVTAESCCGPVGCGCGDIAALSPAESLYSLAEMGDLPDTVTMASLGCGNPTAIAGLKPGETVLDLGSGGGIDCFLSAKAVGPTGHVIGVDMTDSMLALARQNKAKLGADNVEFRKGEIEALPVADNSVDVIISNCVINLSPDKDAVFREAFRVLKPGGRLAVSDIVTKGNFSEQLRANVSAWAGCITGAIDQNDYLQKMRAAGFEDVAIESQVSYGIENLELLDEASRQAITQNLDWATVPNDVHVFSSCIVAHKPEV